MTIILVCILIFAAILASGLAGLFVQHRLPEAQKSESARLIIGQISGVLSLLLSLVLGTLVGMNKRASPFRRPRKPNSMRSRHKCWSSTRRWGNWGQPGQSRVKG